MPWGKKGLNHLVLTVCSLQFKFFGTDLIIARGFFSDSMKIPNWFCFFHLFALFIVSSCLPVPNENDLAPPGVNTTVKPGENSYKMVLEMWDDMTNGE